MSPPPAPSAWPWPSRLGPRNCGTSPRTSIRLSAARREERYGYLAISSQVAKVDVTGTRFFPAEVAPGLLGYLGVLILVPVLAAFAAVRSLRRVQYDPLAVARKATPKPPTVKRLIPLVLGVALLVVAVNMPAGDDARGPASD